MDPDANLTRQRELAAELFERVDAADFNIEEKAIELAALARALDEWLAAGGFLPTAWGRAAGAGTYR